MTLFAKLHGDGAHHGISDLYPTHQKLVERALKSGKAFDTGWYGSKKEIASGRIIRANDTITCEASVSDDFDTEGHGSAVATPAGLGTEVLFDDVVRALDAALDAAGEDKKEKEPYAGFSTHNRKGCWVETLILPKGGEEYDTPPGDNYHEWGWQRECRYMPRKVREVFLRWANNWIMGKKVGGKRTMAGWTIKPWTES